MRKVSFADMQCSVAQALEIVGEWWTLLVIRDCFLGVRRFDDFVERLGISRNVLADRLDKLVAAGVLERQVYDEARHRAEYVLTDKGKALWPVLTTLREWGDEWIIGTGKEPLLVEHRACGNVMQSLLVCDCCGAPVRAGDVRPIAGPGRSVASPLVLPVD
jgi:DNA-binding HxlR family transcriptional regulator